MSDVRASVEAAMARLRAGDPAGALAIAETALAAAPRNAGLSRARFLALTRLGRVSEAARAAAVLDGRSIGAPLLRQIVDVHLAVGQVEKARQALADWTPPAGTRPAEALLAAARIERQSRHSAEALALLREALGLYPEHGGLAIEAARLLAEIGRPEEGIALLRDSLKVSEDPGVGAFLIQLLVDQGRMAEAGDVLAGIPDDGGKSIALAIAAARLHEELGDQARARAVLEAADAAAQNPEIQARRWRILALSGRRRDAIAACRAYLAGSPVPARGLIAAARFLQGAGLIAESDAAMDLAGAAAAGTPDLASAAVDLLNARSDPATALAVLEASLRDSGPVPRLLRQRPQLLRRLGRLREAVAALESLVVEGMARTSDLVLLARIRTGIGDLGGAREALAGLPPVSGRDLAARQEALAEIALAEGRLSDAADEMNRAVEAAPGLPNYLAVAAQYRLFAGDLDGAWAAHVTASRKRASLDPSGALSAKPMRSMIGQILNEFRLKMDPDLLGLYRDSTRRAEAIAALRGVLEGDPGNTPAAILLFAAMRGAGRIGPGSTARCPAPDVIPKKINQFWDNPDVPPQVMELMEANRAVNPDHEHRLFDRRAAEAFLRERGEHRVLRAFDLAPHAAAQADLFRLALLWHEGGIWLDADDRCVAPFGELFDHGCSLVLYQEHLMSIGNNFIAAAPGQPALRAALEDAASAFLETRGETLWLATGPGAISRAVAREAIDAEGHLRDGVRIVSVQDLSRVIAAHIVLPYKSSADHWVHLLVARPDERVGAA